MVYGHMDIWRMPVALVPSVCYVHAMGYSESPCSYATRDPRPHIELLALSMGPPHVYCGAYPGHQTLVLNRYMDISTPRDPEDPRGPRGAPCAMNGVFIELWWSLA